MNGGIRLFDPGRTVDERGEPYCFCCRMCLHECGHIDSRGPHDDDADPWFEGEEVTFAVPELYKHLAERPGVLRMIERAFERFERRPSECIPSTSVGMVIKATSSLSDQTIAVQYRTDREKYRAAGRPALLAFLIEQLERRTGKKAHIQQELERIAAKEVDGLSEGQQRQVERNTARIKELDEQIGALQEQLSDTIRDQLGASRDATAASSMISSTELLNTASGMSLGFSSGDTLTFATMRPRASSSIRA